MEEMYEQLAKRNGWKYSLAGGRPYFMKDDKYAIPDETTSEADKELLAEIISEGSKEMEKLILRCWENGINIAGPCSGIKEYHSTPPFALHFGFIGEKDLIESLHKDLLTAFPDFSHLCREQGDTIRYDINYPLAGIELTEEQSNQIFAIMKEQLELELKKNESIKK